MFGMETVTNDADLLIIGAGAAGLSAGRALAEAGVRIRLLEARDRIGGRVWTVHDPASAVPIELGAEFIHGKAPETFEIVEQAKLAVQEVDGDRWCSRKGQLEICRNLYDEFEKVFERMKYDGPDRSFLEFLRAEGANLPEDLRKLTLEYIEGFEAASPERISEHALVRENKASEEIEGDRAFRVMSGYERVIGEMGKGLTIHLSTEVRAVRWKRGAVEIETERGTYCGRSALVTLPLAVLQAGVVKFEPELVSKQNALAHLESGPVVRVVLRFSERFWEDIEVKGRSMSKMSFLHSDDRNFPTWWTTMPRISTLLTGWSAGPHGAALSRKSNDEVVDIAVCSIAGLLKMDPTRVRELMEASYFHNWERDSYSGGAYSYACVGGIDAARELAMPVESTLFFAGEATEFNGKQGTVAGAIASGQRAAREILEVLAQDSIPDRG